MEEYKLKLVDLRLKENGYAQERYESILPFNSWLALSKIKLHKDDVEDKTFKLPENFSKKTEEFFKFIDEVKADNGFNKFHVTYDDNRNRILEFRKEYNRRLTDDELNKIYLKVAASIAKRNHETYKKFLESEARRKAKEQIENEKRNADYKIYLELKKRFENEGI